MSEIISNSVRFLVTALVFMVLPGALADLQAGEPARIGVLRISPPSPKYLQKFRDGMAEHGHEEGRTYVLVPGWGESRRDRHKIVKFAEKLVADRVDIIVTVGTAATRAARLAAPSTPIVMASAGDPVGSKLVYSLSRPGGNVTGVMSDSIALVPKRLEILKELVPGLHRVATTGAQFRGRVRGLRRLFEEAQQRAGKTLGLEFIQLAKQDKESWLTYLERVKAKGAEAITVRGGTNLTSKDYKEIVAATLKLRVPAMFRTSGLVRIGGLVSYATNRGEQYFRAAAYVDKILKGAKPADLPVERPTKFDFEINLKTARALGIKIPRALLLRATAVVE